MTASPYLLVEDVAALLGCSVAAVHERTRNRAIPHRKIPGGRRCLFLPGEIQAWLDGSPLEARDLPDGCRLVRPIVDERSA